MSRRAWKTVKHIVLDFDGTITTEDTIENIAQAAIKWRKTPEGGGVDMTAAWQRIKDSYAQDLAEYQKKSDKSRRRSWGSELRYLRGLRAIEFRSTQRVKDSELFKGFAEDTSRRLYNAGREDIETGRVKLREGFTELMQHLNELPGPVQLHIVSLNWSASYICGVIGPLGPMAISTITANEIDAEGPIIPGYACEPGEVGLLLTGEDKVWATDHIIRSLHGVCDLYIGDSLGDLACLRAFRGIAIAPGDDQPRDTSLIEALKRVQGPVFHILNLSKESKTAKARWAHSFEDVLVYLRDYWDPESSS